MKARLTAILSICCLALAALGQQTPLRDPNVFAITNAKIVTSPGQVIESGRIIIRGGLIDSVGPSDRTPLPADAAVIDGAGLTVYAGFIDAYSSLGLPASADTIYEAYNRGLSATHPWVRPERRVVDLYQPSEEDLTNWRKNGFTAALSVFPSGLFSGQSAVMALGSVRASENALVQAFGSHLHLNGFGRATGGFGYPGSLMGRIALTRQSLLDAKHQKLLARLAGPGKPLPSVSGASSGLGLLLDHRMPMVADADTAEDLARLKKIAEEFDVPLVAAGLREGAGAIPFLKALNAPAIITLAEETDFLSYDPVAAPGLQDLRTHALRSRNAGLIAQAGIEIAFGTGRSGNPDRALAILRKAVLNGLSKDAALAGLTTGPASAFGISDRVGTISPGKLANLTLVKGDLFEERSTIDRVFVLGKMFENRAPARPAGPQGGRRFGPPVEEHEHDADEDLVDCCKSGNESPVQELVAVVQRQQESERPAPTPAGPVDLSPLAPTPADENSDWIISNATVWTQGRQGVIQDCDILIRNGRIVQVGKGITAGSARVIDGKGMHVTPGIIDAHSHTAISGGVNEGSNISTAEVRIGDVLNPKDEGIYRQLAGGVTAANLLHGSANAIGGQNAVIKFRWGKDAAGLLFSEAPQGIKFALGENPTGGNSKGQARGGGTQQRYPQSRMGVEQAIRERFEAAVNYRRQRQEFDAGKRPYPPAPDLQLDALLEIIDGKRYVHAHSYVQAEIIMLLRVAEKFGFKIKTLQHVLEGYKASNEIATHGAGASTFADWWGYKMEVYEAIAYNPYLMWKKGVLVSINSDSDDFARRLNMEAAKSLRYGGMPEVDALAMVTINPAKQLGVDRYTGSIEAGKQADIAIWDRHPLSVDAVCQKTLVDGILYFDRARDLEFRNRLAAERAERLKAIKAEPWSKETDGPAKQLGPVYAPGSDKRNDGQGTTVITNATIHTGTGGRITGQSVTIKDGKIVAIGKPAESGKGVTVIDAKGLNLFPGLIDCRTTIGLLEVGQTRATDDTSEMGQFNPNVSAITSINAGSEWVPVTRAGGVTTVVSAPTGGLLSGMGTVINLDGWTHEEMAVRPHLGLFMTFPSPSTDAKQRLEDRRKAWEDAMRPIDDYLEQARRAIKAVEVGGHDNELRYEALRLVLKGELPVFASVQSAVGIQAAIEWASKQGLRLVIVGGRQADRVAPLLARHGVPVIYTNTFGQPERSEDGYDDAFIVPARLAAAGVTFAISVGDNEQTRHLGYYAGRPAAFGLSKEDALRSVTLNAAKILGLEHRMGSIEVGKDANLVLVDGDILDVKSTIRELFINGRRVDLETKHTRLFKKFLARP